LIDHRNGNITGNGLVFFEYPGLSQEGEWEILGYENCKEQATLEATLLAKELKSTGR
jgi:hypothetical protein